MFSTDIKMAVVNVRSLLKKTNFTINNVILDNNLASILLTETWRWRKTKLTVHYEILHGHLKTYNNAVKQARISHFQKLINEHKNNQKFVFSTIDLSTNTNFNRSSKTPTDALCKDFADHFRSKITVY